MNPFERSTQSYNRMQTRAQQAAKIYANLKLTMKGSDDDLHKRLSAERTNHQDNPVYAKMESLWHYERTMNTSSDEEERNRIFGLVNQLSSDIMQGIEQRTMSENEFNRLKDISVKELYSLLVNKEVKK